MDPTYPLICTFNHTVQGNGFVANVACQGRVLLVQEDDGFWMSGVNPGSVAAGGKSRGDAFSAFRDHYLSVLFDIATEARSFEVFEQEVRSFFEDIDREAEGAWLAARATVRKGALQLDDLPRVCEEVTPSIEVVAIEPASATPSFNQIGGYSEAA